MKITKNKGFEGNISNILPNTILIFLRIKEFRQESLIFLSIPFEVFFKQKKERE